MADLSIEYTDIQKGVGLMLGWDRDPDQWTTTQDNDFALVLTSGLRKFYGAYPWSFMTPRYTVTTSPPYTTGTITVSGGDVAGSGTSWNTLSATDYWLVVNGTRYEVSSAINDTSITISDTSFTAAAGTTYSLSRYKYTLPEDFGGFIGPLTYAPSQSTYYRPVELISDDMMRMLYMSDVLDNATEIVKAAVVPKSFTATLGQKWELHHWPASTKTVHLTGRYRVVADDLDAVNKYPMGGPQHANTVLYAVLSEAETRLWDNTSSAYTQRYQESLQASIGYDRAQGAPETLGALPVPSSSGMTVRGSLAQDVALYEGHESSIL